MDCASAKTRMEALASRTLPESERALVEQHIAMCEGCRLELELVRAVGFRKEPEGTSQSDWTFDRIFGAEDSAGPESARSAESAAVTGADDPAQYAPPTVSGEDVPVHDFRDPAESAPPGPTLSWDFAPADAKPNLAPPEKSLSFAEEALTRHRDADRKKGSALRLVLWGAGGIAGAALLAFSTWIVLHANAPDGPWASASVGRLPQAAGTAPAPTPESAPPAPESPRDLALSSTGVAAGAPTAVAPAAPAIQDTLLRASAAAPSPLPAASALGPIVQVKRSPTPARSTAHATREARARDASPPAPTHSAPRTSAAAQKAEPAASKPPSAVGSAPEPQSSNREEAIVLTRLLPTPAGPVGDATPEPARPEGQSPGITPTPAPTAHAGPTPPPAPGDAAAKSALANQAAALEPVPAKPEPTKPIDRLHLATVQAAERGDLATLRKHKASWKGFMRKMGVGPDRSRARREFASCLWAIQSLTGKVQDQEEALAAYRDYLLTAPAGGADTESVSRLRQLEDALSERR